MSATALTGPSEAAQQHVAPAEPEALSAGVPQTISHNDDAAHQSPRSVGLLDSRVARLVLGFGSSVLLVSGGLLLWRCSLGEHGRAAAEVGRAERRRSRQQYTPAAMDEISAEVFETTHETTERQQRNLGFHMDEILD